MLDINDEKLRLMWCEESLQGLATLTDIYKKGCLEQEYWNKSEREKMTDIERILQAIVTSLNGIASEIGQIGDSIDRKEIEYIKQ